MSCCDCVLLVHVCWWLSQLYDKDHSGSVSLAELQEAFDFGTKLYGTRGGAVMANRMTVDDLSDVLHAVDQGASLSLVAAMCGSRSVQCGVDLIVLADDNAELDFEEFCALMHGTFSPDAKDVKLRKAMKQGGK